MTEADKNKLPESGSHATTPQVFISHDSRDADLAEAFSKLLEERQRGNDQDVSLF